MPTIQCEPCNGTGQIDYKNESDKNCLICNGTGFLTITKTENEILLQQIEK